MSRINSNIPSMVAARIYNTQFQTLNTSLTRLSTGLRVNTGADDPAGLIASEALRADIKAIKSAQYNIGRANNVVAVAESGLAEVNRLLTDLESLVDKSANEAGLTDAERNAIQVDVDNILTSINRIANSTEFQGSKLLNGQLDYTTSNVAASSFSTVAIYGARVPNNGYRQVVVNVTASAQLARIWRTGGALASAATIEVAGARGTEVLSFASGATIQSVRDAVNQSTALTGVSAYVSGVTGLVFTSTEYGSSKFVSVRALNGTFAVAGGDVSPNRDKGRDSVVSINGLAAVSDGLTARLQTTVLSLKLDMTAARGTRVGSTTFFINGGGADFMITPTVGLNGQESLGVQSVAAGNLGSSALGFLSSLGTGQTNSVASGNFNSAQRVVRLAQTQVAELRGRLGGFQKQILETMNNALDITLENTTAAESAIRDTDFASETSSLTRSQILVQSATSTLRLANQQPQSILALLQ